VGWRQLAIGPENPEVQQKKSQWHQGQTLAEGGKEREERMGAGHLRRIIKGTEGKGERREARGVMRINVKGC